jgi:S-disulfanyl-L-cysteine oxidoreductase SoxD
MFMCKTLASVTAVIVVGASLFLMTMATAQDKSDRTQLGFGTTPTEDELSHFLSVQPDGAGLPTGEGSYTEGQRLYAAQCAACHGMDLQGVSGGMEMPPEMAVMGTDRLIGGRGSLTSANPVFTVESHWPYATTLWDYLKRTMPLMAPGSLSDEEVYSLVAYILGEAEIIPKDRVMDANSVPAVAMPNRDGFVADPRPETNQFE